MRALDVAEGLLARFYALDEVAVDTAGTLVFRNRPRRDGSAGAQDLLAFARRMIHQQAVGKPVGQVLAVLAVGRNDFDGAFLHAIDGSALARTLFPLGSLQKSEVRQLARDYGLANHAKRDSTGICFIGERPFRQFLAEHVSALPGPILTSNGLQVGEHSGLPFYTLGQREGLKVGGRNDSLQSPWFVAAKDLARNALIVVQGRDHPWLLRQELNAGALRWLTGEPVGLVGGLKLHARIRHRQIPALCHVHLLPGGQVHVRFDLPQRSPAPGQYVVFYRDDECLGGGVILETDAAPTAATPANLATA